MRSSASPSSTKRHSESRHSTDDDDVDEDVEDEEDVDVEQCSDSEDLKDSCEPPNKKVHTFTARNTSNYSIQIIIAAKIFFYAHLRQS